MRPTLGLFNVAKDIEFFGILPAQLQRFFTRFPPKPFKEYSEKPTLVTAEDANPFLPNKNPLSNKHHSPIYSLRRQSVLWKLAYKHGVQDLLPKLANNKKFFQEKYDTKPYLRGVLRPKLHKREREAPEKRAKMKEALENADEALIKAKGKIIKRRLEKKQKGKITWV